MNQDGSWSTYGFRDGMTAEDARILPLGRQNAERQPAEWALAETGDVGNYSFVRFYYTSFVKENNQKISPNENPEGSYYWTFDKPLAYS